MRGLVSKTLSLCEVLIFVDCVSLTFCVIDYLYFSLVSCCVCVPVDHSGSASPLMSKRAQSARACKSAKFVSSSDTGLSSDTGSTGGSSIRSESSEWGSLRDTTSVSESCVHNNSCYSSRSCSGSESSSLSSVDTVVSGMEEGYTGVHSPEDRSHGATGASGGSDSQTDAMMDGFFRMLRTGLARYEEAHRHTSASVGGSAGGGMDRNRLVEKLAPYTANTDIAAWIKKFEDDLVDIGVPSRDYKLILARKITSGPALAIISSLDRAECTYADMKRKLIDGLGSNLTSLGVKLLSEFHNTVRPMTSQNAYLHLKSIIDSINLLTGSKDELLLFIATAVFHASRPYHQRGVIDSSRVNSFDDLHTVAQMFTTSDSERQARYSSRTQANVLECYKCHKLGHRAVDCRSGSSHSNSHSNSQSYNVSSSSSNNQRSNNIVCYFCREPGHKSPDCPNKTHNKGSDTNSDSNKKLHLKRGRGPYHANLAEVKNITTHIVGIVNGEECPIVADTGAEITIVPGNLVYEGQITDEAVEIKDWQGSTAVLFTAAVEFVVAGKRFKVY